MNLDCGVHVKHDATGLDNTTDHCTAEPPLTTLPPPNTTQQPRITLPPLTDLLELPRWLCLDEPDMLILVVSRPENFAARRVIRGTWGAVQRTRVWVTGQRVDATFRVGFLLGKTHDPDTQRQIVAEHAETRDIVQYDYHDTYGNLTLKTLAGLKFTTTFCHRTRLMMKIDDDTLPQIPKVFQISKGVNSRSIVGLVIWESLPRREGMYAVSEAVYPGRVYPTYVKGAMYALTADLASALYNLARTTPTFIFEDVYVTGILVEKYNAVNRDGVEFVPIRHRWALTLEHWLRSRDLCEETELVRLFYTDLSPTQLDQSWQFAKQRCQPRPT